MSGAAKTGFFPLIRHLSKHITPLLIATPITANQITSVSLVLGLASAWSVMQGDPSWTVIGAFLLIGEYILDNCDGEVARIKNQCTEFGKRFDTFVDWLVHSAFFAGLGIGVASRFGSDIWLWLGWIAAAGGTVNYAIGLLMDARKRQIDLSPEQNSSPQKPPKNPSKTPETLLDWSVFMMRELARADFCIIVFGLALFDAVWLLLPAAAIGAQVYWGMQFVKGARSYHV